MQDWEIEDAYYLHIVSAHQYRLIPRNSRPQAIVSLDTLPCSQCMRFSSLLRAALAIEIPKD